MIETKNRTIHYGDNLPIMENMYEKSVDLIYLDPPFNKGKTFTGTSGASFDDKWTEDIIERKWLCRLSEKYSEIYDFLDWIKYYKHISYYSYLTYMAIRLIAMRRLLKDTGSIYLHCDQTMSHYLKLLMDCIFGEDQFRNEIVWKRSHPHTHSKIFGKITDTIFFYTKAKGFNFTVQKEKLNEEYIRTHYTHTDEKTGKKFRSAPLDACGLQGGYSYEWNGHTREWRLPKKSMLKLKKENGIYYSRSGLASRKKFLDETSGIPLQNLWANLPYVSGKEMVGYPTQKPLALLERIIKASSEKGDVVLDPFCGSGTTLVAAENLKRQWIGIDKSPTALSISENRVSDPPI